MKGLPFSVYISFNPMTDFRTRPQVTALYGEGRGVFFDFWLKPNLTLSHYAVFNSQFKYQPEILRGEKEGVDNSSMHKTRLITRHYHKPDDLTF